MCIQIANEFLKETGKETEVDLVVRENSFNKATFYICGIAKSFSSLKIRKLSLVEFKTSPRNLLAN